MENIEGGIELELEVGEAEMKNRVPDRILTLLEEKIEAASMGQRLSTGTCSGKESQWNIPSRKTRPRP
jgi:hypothetical protein